MTSGETTTLPLPRICVLMSLYRGTRYLDQQIESIAAQSGVDVHLMARDDGSGDDTADAFRRMAADRRLSHALIEGDNVGACRSFFELIETAPEGFDAYAFADQDDWWHHDKLERAITGLRDAGDAPTLYFCGQTIADQDIMPICDTMRFDRSGFGNALVQNIVQGASAVLNPAGATPNQGDRRPSYAYMHDWWMYVVFTSLGRVRYDHYSGMLYRQHGANVVGVRLSCWARWRDRINRFVGGDGKRSRQAAAFRSAAAGRLDPAEAMLLDAFIDGRNHIIARIGLLLGVVCGFKIGSITGCSAWRC